jgi:hypothetical protein
MIIIAILWAIVAAEAILYIVITSPSRLELLDGTSIGTQSPSWDTPNSPLLS